MKLGVASQIMFVVAIAAVCVIEANGQTSGASTPGQIAPPPHPTPVSQSPAGSSGTSVARPLTITDIISMRQAGLDDSVIVSSLRQNGMASTLGAAELISMRQYGVSNEVIQAMQQAAPLPAPRVTAQSTVLTPAPPTIVTPVRPVVRPVIVAPRYYYPRPIYGHHHHHYHRRPTRTASSFGIHIGF